VTGEPRVAVVVGNPKPKSRTYQAALLVSEQLTGAVPSLVIDLVDLGAALLDWQDQGVADLVERVRATDVVVFASPTYKATYTGLLKLFLDRFPGDALRGVVAVPLMLGGGPGHALAPELTLRPVLAEIGATVPVRGLYVLDASHDDLDAYQAWLTDARPQVAAFRGGRSVALP
jgi:FMN reductase